MNNWTLLNSCYSFPVGGIFSIDDQYSWDALGYHELSFSFWWEDSNMYYIAKKSECLKETPLAIMQW